jgi:uncharacterized protein (DUF2235 family)
MAKNIVFCCDGTWDKTTNKTNVYRLYKALPTTAAQMPFYDDGVGADGLPVDRLLGGAFGTGLFQKVKDAYAKIAHVYEEGDEIFLFGFSRGAYTARSLAGMIAICGLPSQDWDDALVETAFEAYREKNEREALLAKLTGCHMYNAKLKMVGVWDTVGALGIPAIFGGVDVLLYGFLDTSLHEDVLNAYHALAIDERRMEFPATLWTSPPKPGQTIEQVWFCGVHSDVGGGYPIQTGDSEGLADITLSWMMSKAAALGLNVNPDVQKQYSLPVDAKFALDTLHESWNVLWGFPKRRPIAANASIADSVVIRCQHNDGWQPKNLELQNGIPAAHYMVARVVTEPALVAAGVAG